MTRSCGGHEPLIPQPVHMNGQSCLIMMRSAEPLVCLRRSTGTCPCRGAASQAPPLRSPLCPQRNPPWEPHRWGDPRRTPRPHTTRTSAAPLLRRVPTGAT